MELVTILKIVFIVLAFLEAFIAGLCPIYIKSCKESPKFLSIASAFTGGVFLAIALLHILPESVEDYLGLKEGVDDPFPLPNFLFFVGYTLILFVDRIMFDSHLLLEGHANSPVHGKDCKKNSNLNDNEKAIEDLEISGGLYEEKQERKRINQSD